MLKIKVLLLVSGICFTSVLVGMADERKARMGEIISVRVLQTAYQESHPWKYRENSEDKTEHLELQQKVLSPHASYPRLDQPQGAAWLTFTFKVIAAGKTKLVLIKEPKTARMPETKIIDFVIE